MKRKTRLIILLICVVLFLVVVPYIVLYSVGYRVDFENQKIVATGGIYVRVFPTGVDVSIDNGAIDTTGYFYSSVFVQNLLPGVHHVSITKEEYYNYQKNLLVEENEVTKLENVTLFKKDIGFQALPDIPATATTPLQTATAQFTAMSTNPADVFTLKNNTIFQKTAALIKNVAAYNVDGNSLLWLGTDGGLYRSDMQGQNTQTLADAPITSIPLLKTAATSPDNLKIAYYNGHELWYWLLKVEAPNQKVLLQTSKSTIKNVYWVNNDYLIFSDSDNIIISEIDVRGNINTITLTTAVKPQLFFDQQDKKLYIFTQNTLVVSDRLLP